MHGRIVVKRRSGAVEAYREVLEHEPGDDRAAWALSRLEAQESLSPDDAPGPEGTESLVSGSP